MVKKVKEALVGKELRQTVRWGKPVEELTKEELENFPRLLGWRKVENFKTEYVELRCADGQLSRMDIPRAALVEVDGNLLSIYNPGIRELNESEKKVWDEWMEIENSDEYQKQLEYDCLTDGSSTYWKKKHFFENKGYLYLMQGSQKGLRRVQGKPEAEGKILLYDENIRGELFLQYEMRDAAV
ncbi:MAG: hypothetical protein E7272_07580 [Pseudobutyrivibrio ruminis]|uniref:Uncharacterized protein n=1 Tax=Pseudobutyrivibrio ruminis TaxID=46206 RepID=A0A927UD50_9FIRM|nr:hypothetical protein [Pseudobutyrivibrio ruminis]